MSRRAKLRAAVAAASVIGAAFSPAVARALTFHPCGLPGGIRCATVRVPLDRSGSVGGTIGLHVRRIAAPAGNHRKVLIALAGGPGERATAYTLRFQRELAPALRTRDLVVFDQRGLGRSAAIHCAALEQGGDPKTAVPSCASQLGPSKSHYTTPDSADDIDAIRRALGVQRVDLFAVSYGTWVAQVYARRHPTHVHRLVLDSPVVPSAIADPFGLHVYRGFKGAIGAICTHRECRGMTNDLARDALRVLDRLDAHPLKASFYDANGHAQRTTVNRLIAVAALRDLDLRPNVRAELPRAIAGVFRGDNAPLVRLVAAEGPASIGKPDQINHTVNVVTQCEEQRFPWTRGASPDHKLAQARAALKRIPRSAFSPVTPEIAFAISLVPTCAYWPDQPQPPVFGPKRLPHVPVLVVSGESDLRTPRSSALEAHHVFKGSQLLAVPNVGHSGVAGDPTPCARHAVQRFLLGGQAGSCADRDDPYAPRLLVPTALKQVDGAAGVPGRRGRILHAVALTVNDGFQQLDDGHFGLDGRTAGGGLRGGSFRRAGDALHLSRYVFVPGVTVDGAVPRRGTAHLHVTAGGLSGQLFFHADGTVTGQLGGAAIHAHLAIPRRTVSEILEARFGTPPILPGTAARRP
ncbi:MAG: alpha/beta hydrolase [Actinobacteria bacterium]|nr:MAG: alpha/beta hydrolase [Actinomycetota bacterium]